jgi:transcriptional regulator with XRE-family HTH domain/sRNA-binding regulator protein Hfq
MPEPLWKIRQRKGLRVNQLAARSGVPAISIQEYESGRAIRSADLPKLAKALYVEEWDIEIKGDPRPKPKRRQDAPPPRRPKAEVPAPERPRAEAPAPEQPQKARRKPLPPAPARPTQIEHLLTMTRSRFGKDRDVLEKEIGKPLEEMTKREAGDLLKHYQQLLITSQSPKSSEEPVGVKRRRAYLPESVDGFECNYLTARQEDKALLRFTLFDGQQVRGRVIGFSPYSITLRDEETGEALTLQKLAIAYYRQLEEAS